MGLFEESQLGYAQQLTLLTLRIKLEKPEVPTIV
jgi:hypothetical protein